MIQKQVACEEPPVHEWGDGQRAQLSLPDRAAATAAVEMSAATMAGVDEWARGHRVDRRAALAAIAAQAAHTVSGTRELYVVTNGRDVEIPGSSSAMGMFWYFRRITATDGLDRVAVARLVHDSGNPLSAVREAVRQWSRWPDGVSFNYTRQSPRASASPISFVGHRDVFHQSAQIGVTAHPDGTARVSCTSLAGRTTAELLKDSMAALLESEFHTTIGD